MAAITLRRGPPMRFVLVLLAASIGWTVPAFAQNGAGAQLDRSGKGDQIHVQHSDESKGESVPVPAQSSLSGPETTLQGFESFVPGPTVAAPAPQPPLSKSEQESEAERYAASPRRSILSRVA